MSNRRASGLKAWVFQRITAVYLGLFVLYLTWYFIFSAPATHPAWSNWLASPHINISFLFFTISLLFHAWIGMRDVVLDYIHPLIIRVLVLILIGIGLISSGLWVMKLLFLTVTLV